MKQAEPIHRVANELGLTSRTLRHWEDEGLFTSLRDAQSGWRAYDAQALGRIRFTVLMRRLDIPVRQIKAVLDSGSPDEAASVLADRLNRLRGEGEALLQRKALLDACLAGMNALAGRQAPLALMESALEGNIHAVPNIKQNWEESIMSNHTASIGAFRIISLPAMRVAVCNVVSASPEDEALSTVLGWAAGEGLMGTARIFGFNTTAYEPGAAQYGWAACVTVPEQVAIPAHLQEKRLPGGLYAMLASTNEIYDSWQALTAALNDSTEVELDNARPCLEEHIRSGNPAGSGSEYFLNLLEPVRRK